MEESELPSWLLRDDAELDKMREENEAKENYGEGARNRKEVDYSDRLTEREFLMAVDEGKLDEVVEAKRARHAQRKAEGFEDDEELEDEEEEDDEDEKKPSKRGTSGGRKRGRPSAAQSAAMLADASFTRPNLDRKKQKEVKVDRKLLKKMKFLINCVIKYKDTDMRVLSEPFYQLPTRRVLPDYYEIIKKPIDLKRIQTRIKDNKYHSLDMLQADVEMMAKNTQEYNVEGSLIYEDSIVLLKVFKSARSRLESEPAEESSESAKSEEESDDQDKSMMHNNKSEFNSWCIFYIIILNTNNNK